MKNTFIDSILEKSGKFFFISPHLDDAVFSAGELIYYLRKKKKNVTVINVFTKSGSKPYTLSARKFLKSCGYQNAEKLFADRIKEDKTVLSAIGVKIINLGFTDALWRKKGNRSPIAELNHVYPFFRLSIARGYISIHDKNMIKKLKSVLHKNINPQNNTFIFCPAGIGKHTDHIIVRDTVANSFKNVVFWQDYPYVKSSQIDPSFVKIRKLKKTVFSYNKSAKNKLINGYKSQIKAIFGINKETVKMKENYYFSR